MELILKKMEWIRANYLTGKSDEVKDAIDDVIGDIKRGGAIFFKDADKSIYND